MTGDLAHIARAKPPVPRHTCQAPVPRHIRALAIARKAGIVHAFGMVAPAVSRFPLNNIVRESFAWAKDILSGNA